MPVFKKVFTLVKKNLLLILLLFISGYVSYKNYVPHTFLTGWDTLHPEFDLRMYWGRIIDGVWQEHQGLGAVGSQAHASEIPRILILQVLNLFLALNQIRYFYAFLMLILGPLGIYLLLRFFTRDLSENASKIGAFSGGLLYLLNLGTLQHFYVPLEMFLTHYGFLGFVYLTATKYFDTGARKTLLWFFVVSFFIIPQAHTPTLFYAFVLTFFTYLTLLLLVYLLKRKLTFRLLIARYFSIAFLCLGINLFWLGPNVYFALNHGEEIQQSKIHQLFSTEAFLANKRYGNIADVAVLKNFLFKWGEHVGNAQFGDLLQEWSDHLNGELVRNFGYAFFGVIVLGLLFGILMGNRYAIAVGGVFFVSMFFLFTDNPPLGFIFTFLQNHVPLFKEAFRFPFTKFSISLMLSYGVFFGMALAYFILLIEKIVKQSVVAFILRAAVLFAVVVSLSAYMWPAFKGFLISPSMKVSIPQRYFEMFEYFKKQEAYGRVANMPLQSFWGWVYHNWDPTTELGYQGAGFLWFGIKQPLMDREFDRWNLLNEQYYKEMSYAVYSENPTLVIDTLNKYKIRWVLVDESIIAPGTDEKELFFPQIESLLPSVPGINLAKDFGEGLRIYEYKPEKEFYLTETVGDYYAIGNSNFKEQLDPIYGLVGNYVSITTTTFPFVGLLGDDERVKEGYVTYDTQSGNQVITGRRVEDERNIPFVNGGGFYAPVEVWYKKTSSLMSLYLNQSSIPDFDIKIDVPRSATGDFIFSLGKAFFYGDKNNAVPSRLGTFYPNKELPLEYKYYLKDKSTMFEQTNSPVLEPCGSPGKDSSYEVSYIGNGFNLVAKGMLACVTTNLEKILGTDVSGGLIRVSYVADQKENPRICIFNNKTGLCENEVLPDNSSYLVLNDSIANYYLRFYSDGRMGSSPNSVNYQDITVDHYQKVSEALVTIKPSPAPTAILSYPLVPELSLSGTAKKLLGDPRVCSNGSREFVNSSAQMIGESMVYESVDEGVCDSYWFPSADHAYGYLLEFNARNISGTPLRVCLTNEYSKRCDLYLELPKGGDSRFNYLVPPIGKGKGYTVNLSNLSFGEERSMNELRGIRLIPLPFGYLTHLHVPLEPYHVKDKNLLLYNQAYEKGWLAVCGFGLCSADHVKVNNWANGWVFSKDYDLSKVRIVFWPQLLEYIGFVVLVLTLMAVIFRKTRPSVQEPYSVDK
jgi:hypothetical protein